MLRQTPKPSTLRSKSPQKPKRTSKTPKIPKTLKKTARKLTTRKTPPLRNENTQFSPKQQPLLTTLLSNFSSKTPTAPPQSKAKKVVIPANYQPIDSSRLQREQKIIQNRDEELRATMPGEYTIYRSKYANIPLFSLVTVSLISISNIPMFDHWAQQGLWDLPELALYALGAGTIFGLGYAHVSLSRRWLKRITCKIHHKNKAPSTVSITTGGWVGFDEVQEVPVSAFRGLPLTHKGREGDDLGALVTLDCRIKQNYLITWARKSHFANPAGLLERVLGLNDVDHLVTSKGHTFDGKLYSDEDFHAVMSSMRKKNSKDIMLPSQVKAELERSSGESLSFEKSRAMGIFTREQEMDCLDTAKKHYLKMQSLYKDLSYAESSFQHEKAAKLREDINEVNALAKSEVKKASHSMTQKALHVFNPELDFDGYTKEDAMDLFKEVIQTQSTGKHPRTTMVLFNFGKGNPTSDDMKQLANMYIKSKNLKAYWGGQGTKTEGVLTVVWKAAETNDMLHSELAAKKKMEESGGDYDENRGNCGNNINNLVIQKPTVKENNGVYENKPGEFKM
jgi:hypothetical protein